MNNINKIEYAIQNMYFFKQFLSKEDFQEFLEDFILLYKNRNIFNAESNIYRDIITEKYEVEIQEIYFDSIYETPNFTFNKSEKNASFEDVYLAFKHLYGLIQKNQFKDALEFFDLMPIREFKK
ncbi:MAG: hypothetical protein IJY92_04670 [Alphaproteobacteria bacterium]|nr:hypothetical protein [Alphaproteobacteria bacterium]